MSQKMTNLKTETELTPVNSNNKPIVQVVINAHQDAIVSSVQISKVFGKQHKNIIKKIKTMECSKVFARLNFKPSYYLNQQNKQQPSYEIKKDGFIFLAVSFTGVKAAKFKEDYINEFNRIEKELQSQKLQKTIELQQKNLKLEQNNTKLLANNQKLEQQINKPKPIESHLEAMLKRVNLATNSVDTQILQIINKNSVLSQFGRINTYKALVATLKMCITHIEMVHHIEVLQSIDGNQDEIDILNNLINSIHRM